MYKVKGAHIHKVRKANVNKKEHYKSFHSNKESIDFDVQYNTETAKVQSLEKIHVIKVIIVKLESSGISGFQYNRERCMALLGKDSNTTRWEKRLADC